MEALGKNVKPVAYFDTNALNFFCDEFKGKSKRPFKNFDIPLSWALIDEIECNTSFARIIDLANFAWQIFNKNIFMTANGVISLELESVLRKLEISLSNYYDSDQAYLTALNEARKGIVSNRTRQKLREDISGIKRNVQNWERGQRKKWSPHFGIDKSLTNDWNQFYSRLSQERYFNQVLYGMVETYGLSNRFTRNEILSLDYTNLPTVSIGIEFYVALQFLIDSQSKKLGKPDRGDLQDMQHCFYIGLCDYFVTDDPRVRYILINLIDTKSSKIIGTEEFLQVVATH